MHPQLQELLALLQQLIAEHESLLHHLDAQQAAMRKLDARAMEEAAAAQEASRQRIARLELRRRVLASQLATALRLPQPWTLTRLADAMPQARPALLALRDRLRERITAVGSRSQVAGRLAGAVLGHLNTAVRIIAGAAEQAGLYTRDGSAKVAGRIGVMEAVG